jgi:hypothetical protein
MTKNRDATLMPVERISHSILILRGHRVLLDSDLAALYEAPTKRLNEQVKRNIDASRKTSCFGSRAQKSRS